MLQLPYSSTPKLTVVLGPDAESPLPQRLHEAVALLCQRHEVQLVLFRPDLPMTEEELADLPEMTVLPPPSEGASSSQWRRLALAAATGDIVLFASGNDAALQDRLSRMIEAYRLPVRLPSYEEPSGMTGQLPLSVLAEAPPQ